MVLKLGWSGLDGDISVCERMCVIWSRFVGLNVE